MRRQDGGAGRGARGREVTHLMRSGGAGAPPGGTMIPCQELADGEKPLALPDTRTGPSARGWITGSFGKVNSRQKRGPAAGRRRKWSAGRRLSVIANGGDTSPQGVSGGLRKAAQEVSQPPRFPALRSLIGSARQEKGLPGASNNTGDESRALLLREKRFAMIRSAKRLLVDCV